MISNYYSRKKPFFVMHAQPFLSKNKFMNRHLTIMFFLAAPDYPTSKHNLVLVLYDMCMHACIRRFCSL